MVDLDTIKKGDRILVELEVRYDAKNNERISAYPTDWDSGCWSLKIPPQDIKEVIAKPFDWNNVKAGMAFNNEGYDSILYYVGKDMTGTDVFEWPKIKKSSCGRFSAHNNQHILTRAPEHDLPLP